MHVKEIGCSVTIFSLKINDGDLIHADRHGAVVIPKDIWCPETSINKLLDTEQLILKPAKQSDFDFGKFKEAWEAFEAART